MAQILTPIRILAVAVLAALFAPAGWSVTVQATLERSSIMVGESTTLKIVVEGGVPRSLGTVESVPNLNLQFTGRSQELISVNGQTTTRQGLNFNVSATQAGRYTIPAIPVVVDGGTYSSQPVELTVTKSEINAQNRHAFFRLIIPRDELYVGEVVPVELQLYVAGRGDNLREPTLKSDGFVVHKQAAHAVSSTQIGNTPYSVVSFKMAISAAKAGQLELGPAEVSFSLLLPVQRNPGDPFGDFFGPRYQRRNVTVTSPVETINVLPLPRENVPASFTGAIGRFSWEVSGGPTNLNAGDPITLKATIAGQGNWDLVKLPEIDWPGFKAYSPNGSMETIDPLGIEGRKKFEQVVVPEHTGVSEIPQLEFSYFHPGEKTYRTLSSPAMPITVGAGSRPQAQPSLANLPDASDVEIPPVNDIVHIKPSPGTLLAISQPLVRQPWFWILQAVPLLAFLGSVVWRRQQDRLENNPRLRRRLAVHQTIQHGLTDLRGHAEAGRAEEFYATAFRLMQEQLGERLEMPAYSITEAVLDESLPRRGASENLIKRLHELFQICNQARYSPQASSGDLNALIPRVEAVLHELQELPD